MNVKYQKQLIILATTIGLLVLLHAFGILAPVERLTQAATNPVLAKLYATGATIRRSWFGRSGDTLAGSETAELRARLNELTAKNAELESLREENDRLRQLLEFKKRISLRTVVADVIARGDFFTLPAPQPEITIDKGAADGLIRGLAVVNEQGMVVGKVTEVSGAIARVIFTTDSHSKLAATVQSSSQLALAGRTAGIAEGSLNLTIEMNFIPQTEAIAVGDTVVTSGLEENIPRGLVIGTIKEVHKESNAIWQTATIEPPTNFDDLVFVAVILP